MIRCAADHGCADVAAFTMRTYVHASDEDLKQGTNVRTLVRIQKIA